MIQIRSKDSQVKTQLVLWIFILFKVIRWHPPYTHRQRYINEDEIVPNTDNLLYLQFYILQFYTGYRYYRIE
jgi:hypothetical protein